MMGRKNDKVDVIKMEKVWRKSKNIEKRNLTGTVKNSEENSE